MMMKKKNFVILNKQLINSLKIILMINNCKISKINKLMIMNKLKKIN